MTMNPSCRISFVHQPNEKLQITPSANNIYEAINTMIKIKDAMISIRTGDHEDFLVPYTNMQTTTTIINTSDPIPSCSSANDCHTNPMKVRLQCKPMKSLRMFHDGEQAHGTMRKELSLLTQNPQRLHCFFFF